MGAPLRFSVGIPAFNQGEYLEATILSLLNQTRPPDEIVISDHYSTDQTPEIIAKYARQIRGVRPPPGVGVSGQWNFTFSQLSGDWVTLLSSDDLARPNFCEVMLRGAARREDSVLVRAAWENIGPKGEILSQEYLLSVPRVEQSPENLLSQMHGPKASFAAFAVRRETLNSSGGYPRGMESFGDWPLFAQLAPLGSFIYENEIVSGYRIGYDQKKFRKRLGLWLRDEMRMFNEVLPLAATRAGMIRAEDRAWIVQASRDNFLRYLASASQEFAPDERAEIAPLFEAWAEQTGNQMLLAEFATGRRIRQPVTIAGKAKRILRPIAQKAVSLLYGR
jgi:glycosyltransferase involved in cell wall biosynthesis